MTLKTNTWYAFAAPNGEPYVEGVTELIEVDPKNPPGAGYVYLNTNSQGAVPMFRTPFGATPFDRVGE